MSNYTDETVSSEFVTVVGCASLTARFGRRGVTQIKAQATSSTVA
jgi:hypothetical protein